MAPEVDVDGMFPATTHRTVKVPWYPIGHVTVTLVAAVVGALTAGATYPARLTLLPWVVAIVAAAVAGVLWAASGPWRGLLATAAFEVLVAGGTRALAFAPFVLGVIAIATLSVRALKRRADTA